MEAALAPEELGDEEVALVVVAQGVEDLVVDEQQLVQRVLVEAHLLQHVEGSRRDLLQVPETDQPVQERQAPVVEVVQP